MSPSDNIDAGLRSEATRILFQAHREYIIPKLEVAVAAINAALSAYPKLTALGRPDVRLLIQPDRDSGFIEFSSSEYAASNQLVTAKLKLAQSVLTQAWEANPPPGSTFILPTKDSLESVRALALVIGDRGQNQQFSGVLLLAWNREETADTPLFDPPEFEAPLPVIDGCQLLPLPPRFENSRTPPEWIGIAQTIKKLPEWQELDQEVTKVAALGTPIIEQLVPILSDAAWKSMAGRVMHELSRTVALPQPSLNEARKALNSALSTLRRSGRAPDNTLEVKMLKHIQTIDQNLSALQEDQNFVESKVRWFFYLVAEELRSEAVEKSSFHEILKQTINNMGYQFDQDAVLENPNDIIWNAYLAMPKHFPQHCFESLMSNSFIHRNTSAPVHFSLKPVDAGTELVWENTISEEDLRELEIQLSRPAPARTFGLRMADAISTSFFQSPLKIELIRDGSTLRTHHRLYLDKELLRIPAASSQTNVSTF